MINVSSDIVNRLYMWGCDTDEAVERVLGNEDMYVSLINEYCTDEDIEKLDNLILNKEEEDAFALAHTMKGVYGNLGLTPIYDVICEVVELLRDGMKEGIQDKMLELHDAKEELDEIMSDI